MRRQIEREMRAVIDQAEKNDLPLGLSLLDLASPEPSSIATASAPKITACASPPYLDDEALRAPDRHEKALAIQNPGANPFALAAAQPCSLETRMRIEVRGSHPPRLTCARRHRNRISVCATHKAVLNEESAVTSFSIVHRTMNRTETVGTRSP